MSTENKKLLGLVILGSLFIMSSLAHIRVLANYDWYKYCVGDLPQTLISIRYFMSWTQRILGITMGAGLIAGRRWAAQLAIFLSIFDILTVYWRYPYESFKRQAVVWDDLYGGWIAGAGFPDIHFSSYALHATVLSCVLDVLFFSFVLYYLTRPHVQKYLT